MAGVTKSFSADAVEALTSAEIIKKCRHAESPVTLSVKQLEVLADKIDFLEEEAKDGRLYRESIKTKVKKLWLQRLPLSGEACVNSVCDRMETPELLALQKAFSAADAPQLQLYSPLVSENSDDDVFKI